MISMTPLSLRGGTAIGISVELPQTHLVIAATKTGYLMCGALDVGLLDRLLGQRRVIAARALGVRTINDLLDRPLESVTAEAGRVGLAPGMPGRQALEILLEAERLVGAGVQPPMHD